MTTLAQCSFAVWATYVNDPFSPPFVDADRRGGNAPEGGLSLRARFAIGFAVFVALWLFARVNGYWQ